MSGFVVTERNGSIRFTVRVQPRSSRNGVVGLHGSALKVGVHSPPVAGAANQAVIDVLAAALGVPRRALRIVSGAAARTKIVEVDGVTAGAVRALAGQPLAIRSSG